MMGLAGWRRKVSRLWRYWLRPVLPVGQARRIGAGYVRYLSQWRLYANMEGAEPLAFEDSYPCPVDATPHTPFDAHYLYQAAWAAERICCKPFEVHVDLGSDLRFVSQLAVSMSGRVIFVDLRPPLLSLPGLICLPGDLLHLPFADNSLRSVSCLHVAEHLGLGRYGDRLEPSGTRIACAEMQRVLAPGGDLYFSVPIGRPRTEFNAHRIHSTGQIRHYFDDLEWVEFSAVGEDGRLHRQEDPNALAAAGYACGLFHFRKGSRP